MVTPFHQDLKTPQEVWVQVSLLLPHRHRSIFLDYRTLPHCWQAAVVLSPSCCCCCCLEWVRLMWSARRRRPRTSLPQMEHTNSSPAWGGGGVTWPQRTATNRVHRYYLVGVSIIGTAVLRIRIRRILLFLGLPDPDPLVKDTDTDPDPSIIKQKW